MIKKINYNHSLIFFISCIFLSSFDYLRSNSFILICFFLILILGVSHGALDNIKGRKLIKILKIKNISYFYLVYILIGLGIILLWILFPQSLLLLFLIIASYHFGKEDSEFISKNKKESFLLKTFKGSIIIVSPLLFNQNKTLEIFNSINFNLSNIGALLSFDSRIAIIATTSGTFNDISGSSTLNPYAALGSSELANVETPTVLVTSVF